MLTSTISFNTSKQIQYTAGLVRQTYTDDYFADDLSWFDDKTPATEAVQTSSLSHNIGTYDSERWRGYFRPTTTETYTFYTASDDSSWVWIGNPALSPTSSNEVVDNSGLHTNRKRNGTIALTAGLYYPILIYHGNNAGQITFTFSYSTSTITETSTLTGLIYYNPFTSGF